LSVIDLHRARLLRRLVYDEGVYRRIIDKAHAARRRRYSDALARGASVEEIAMALELDPDEVRAVVGDDRA
jgi:hypothetical protein